MKREVLAYELEQMRMARHLPKVHMSYSGIVV
jgi:hypothetical protein